MPPPARIPSRTVLLDARRAAKRLEQRRGDALCKDPVLYPRQGPGVAYRYTPERCVVVRKPRAARPTASSAVNGGILTKIRQKTVDEQVELVLKGPENPSSILKVLVGRSQTLVRAGMKKMRQGATEQEVVAAVRQRAAKLLPPDQVQAAVAYVIKVLYVVTE